nr:S8 family serine peptidase [Neobacillus terrae]
MPAAWDQTRGSAGIIVAVVDRGVQVNHPDLAGKIVSPIDILTGKTTFSPSEHGTHVAGIIAASINNTGVAGIAPNVKIMPVNVFQGEYANVYDIVNGIYYAVNHHANIINLSLGSPDYSYALDNAVQYAASKGVLVIAAAGNESTSRDTYPASFKTVTGVSATDSNDKITSFSNFGNYIDLSAPGESIYSTISGSSYQWMSGTSMAAPVVSGAAALILSKNPSLSPAQVIDTLKRSALDLGTKGWDQYYGAGRIDVLKALQMTMGPVSNVSLSSAKLMMNGTNKTVLSFTSGSGTNVSLYIQDSKGKIVKSLLNKKSNGVNMTASWEGKKDNGAYAPAGTYKFVVRATNGIQTIYQSVPVLVTDQITPSITAAAFISFSPAASSKAEIVINANKDQYVTANIYDKNNKLVRKILSTHYLYGGKGALFWDGKNSNGVRMGDGNYRLAISSVDSYKRKSPGKNLPIKLDTAKPKANLKLLSSIFKSSGASWNSLVAAANEDTYVSAYVIDGKGNKLKSLGANLYHKPVAFSFNWDGTNNDKQPVPEGNYQYLLEIKDLAGNKTLIKSPWVKLMDWRKPIIGAPATIEYRNVGSASYTYSLSKPAKVTIEVYQNGQMVKTIQQALEKGKGINTFNLDLSSNLLSDGVYQYQIMAADKYSQIGFFKGNLTVALGRTVIGIAKTVQLHKFENGICEVHYSLSEPANITIEVFDSSNRKIRTLLTNAPRAAGKNSFSWDGYDDKGNSLFTDGSSYYYKIKAINTVGNETSVEGKISMDQPEWLLDQSVNFTTDGSGFNQEMVLTTEATQPLKVGLEILNGPNGELLDSQTYNLATGAGEIRYQKPVKYNLFYNVIFEDQLGNQYFYEFDENNP